MSGSGVIYVIVEGADVETETPRLINVNDTEPQEATDAGEHFRAPEGLPWNLILVNAWNPLDEPVAPRLTDLANGQSVDARIYPALMEMLSAARAAGLSPLVCSAYRTVEKQQSLYANRLQRCLNEGLSPEAAEAEAARWVARPGTSEHQTGLAVDIVALDYQLLDQGQERTPEQKWLMQNCWKYGFILRYPGDKSAITGIHYEPWHYRYVGPDAAREIAERGMCLEEYLLSLGE